MINRVVLVGRITKELELKKTPSGASVLGYTLAVNRIRKADGQPDADFINCVTWNKQAENMAQYLHKGSLIGIEGRIQTRSYDDANGRKVYVTEVLTDSVQFLESKGNGAQNQFKPQNEASYAQYNQNNYAANQTIYENNNFMDIDDGLQLAADDLPF